MYDRYYLSTFYFPEYRFVRLLLSHTSYSLLSPCLIRSPAVVGPADARILWSLSILCTVLDCHILAFSTLFIVYGHENQRIKGLEAILEN